jgi:PKD repeat protein
MVENENGTLCARRRPLINACRKITIITNKIKKNLAMTFQQFIYTITFITFSFLQINAQVWKEVGPIQFPSNSSGQINGIGRVTQLKFHPTSASILYATSASGGAYKSIDTGHNWTLLNTDNFAVTSMSCICIDPTNDQNIYLGTGDPNYYSTDFSIYKSINGGATWVPANTNIATLLPIEIIINPTNNQELITATNNGIWRTTNGAATWVNVKAGGAFTDMQRIPNTNTIIASTGTQVWRSTDFGNTWVQNTSATFSQAGASGMRINVNPSSNNIVYAISNGNNGVIFRSIDYGATFTNVYSSTTACLVCYDELPANAGQGNYNFASCTDPTNANHLYVAAHCLWESNDSGATWQRKTAWPTELHTDHHQFIFSPYDNTKFYSINDGGIWIREGLNDSLWQPLSDGITATEIYHAANSPLIPKLVSIGTQDNGEAYYDNAGWFTNRGGDWGSRMAFDFSAENNVYYLENGKRRPFTPQSGSNDFNCPFTPTNNARIAFSNSNKNLAIIGKDTLWMTTDLNSAAPTWVALHNTTFSMRDVVISQANNSTVYSVHNTKIFRVENIFTVPVVTTINAPNGTATRGSITTIKQNDSVIYVSCNSKIFRSSNKGTTWANISYNLPTTNILKIYHDDFSSNETMYLCTGNQIFTKTKADTIWQNISANLPKIANINDFIIMNDSTVASKLRVAYYGRGVWEYKLHPSYAPIASFTAPNSLICIGNSITFNNTSVDDSLTYNWTFTGGSPSTSTQKNPTITYNTAGSYAVSLVATNNYGNHTKTINNYIEVISGSPKVDSLPGKALLLNGASTSFGNGGILHLNTNTATFMCWIKPQGIQNDWAGLIFCRGNSTTSGMSIKSNNEIRYHWNDNNYGFSSGLYAPSNEWSHCALVITPTKTIIYVNGVPAVHNTINDSSAFDADIMIGLDANGGSRIFNGLIDEVAIYNKALTQNEIREQMHLIKKNNVADSLKCYWQMNNVSSNNTILNKANCTNQLMISSTCFLTNSTAPFGAGNSELKTVNAAGLFNFANADLSITMPNAGAYPNGELCVSHIFNSPDEMPNNATPSEDYFIVDNYGLNKTINSVNAILMNNCGQINGNAAQYSLHGRGANADGNSWSASLCSASTITTGANGNIDYNPAQNIYTLGQFVANGPYWPTSISTDEKNKIKVFPNPTKDIFYIHQDKNSPLKITIYTAEGKIVLQQTSSQMITPIDSKIWTSGIYFYQLESEDGVQRGKVEIIK